MSADLNTQLKIVNAHITNTNFAVAAITARIQRATTYKRANELNRERKYLLRQLAAYREERNALKDAIVRGNSDPDTIYGGAYNKHHRPAFQYAR